jgi:hypothetical protein
MLTFDTDLGPNRVRCHLKLSAFCEGELTIETLTVDRKQLGGSYARHNIQPACKPCQDRQGGFAGLATHGDLMIEYHYTREQWEIAFERETGYTYEPGIIAREKQKERRGGRREVTDFIADNPPPVFSDWLSEWSAARREPDATDGPWSEQTG